MDDDNRYRYERCRSTCAQVVTTLAFNTLMVNVGLVIGMPVLVIGALRLHKDDLAFTEEQASWFGGLVFMVQPLGSVVSGFLQDVLGRKTCMMAINVPQCIAWLMMYQATSVTTLFVAVTILGLSLGFMEAPVLSYIGEVTEPRLRGVLSTFGGIFFNIGLLLEVFIGAVTDWRSTMLYTAIGPVVAFLALAAVPDSPAWLVSKGRVEDAQKAYQWLRGWVPPNVIQEELSDMVTYVKNTRRPRVVTGAEYKTVATTEGDLPPEVLRPADSMLKLFLHPSVQRPLRLIIICFFVGSCASLSGMRPFFIEVLQDMHLPISPHLFVVFFTVLTFLGALTSTLTMHKLGKRGIFFLSLGASVICCMGLGVYLALGVRVPWVPLIILSISSYAATFGIIFVPWVLISELFPLKARGIASGVAAAVGYFIIFLNIKTYYNVVSLLSMAGACFFYGTIGLLGFIYLYFRLPETEGVTLEVIEGLFGDRNSENLTRAHVNPDRTRTD